jgi:hypothetical protein
MIWLFAQVSILLRQIDPIGMKRMISILSCLLLVACTPSVVVKVDLRKAFRQKTAAKDLYTRVDVIPLRVPEEVRIGQRETLLEVAADRFFLLDKNEILVFDGTGDYLTTIRSSEKIIDFSAYGDRVLDVLTEGAITEYDIKDGSHLETYPIRDNDVILTSVAKVDDDSIDMSGYLDGTAYDCGYLVDRAYFYTVPRPAADYLATHAYVPAAEMQNCRFFRCDGSVYGFLSRSGEIDRYTGDDFIYPAYEWDFGKRSPDFTNAQMMKDRIFLAFELDGYDYVLVYNLKNRKYQVVESDTFPLGVIYSGSNYYCCPARRLEEYVFPGTVTLSNDIEYILLKYTL